MAFARSAREGGDLNVEFRVVWPDGSVHWLRDQGVRRLAVAGLATDYCVRASVLDALREGFEVEVVEDAVGAVDVNPGDGERALAEMRKAGAAVTGSNRLG